MKIIGIVASARKGKSSRYLLEQCLAEIKGIDTELIELAGQEINGCLACDACKKGVLCSQDDDFQAILTKLSDPELVGIIVATPVYMGSMSSQAKALLDRTVLFRRNGFLFKNKLGGAIAVGGSRNGGQELTIQGIHAAMMIHDMIIVGDGDHFGGAAWGNHPDGYEHDSIGVTTAQKLGRKMAEVATMLHS